MTYLRMARRDGGMAALDEKSISALQQRLRGTLLRPTDQGYDAARSIWNGMFDRKPVAIACCTGAADVAECVRFARSHELVLAVRGGGHNIAGHAACDSGLMIDLSAMNTVRADPQAKTAWVEGGAIWADVDRGTQRYGLAVSNGVVSTTGVGGLTLGGGFGRLSRKYGLTIDNLIAAEIVTADGHLITASANQNADLFWGIRGGGGNFGIVTSFQFRLHEIGTEVLFGPIVYRLEDARDVLSEYAAIACDAPRECSVWADFVTAPPLPFIPEEFHGTKVLLIAPFYAGDLARGEEVVQPFRTLGDPVADAVTRMPYIAAQSAVDALYVSGAQNYWQAQHLIALPPGAIDALVRHAEALPTPQSDILISHLGGAINDVAPDATAYTHRNANFVVTAGARWDGSEPNDAAIAWVRDCVEAHAAGGSYSNFISEASGREREAFGENHDQLVALKNRFDPSNLFRLNQNIRPTPAE